MIEGFMLEAKWLNSGEVPNLEDYIENGVTTAGSYMALVHIFFLIGQGVTEDNVKLLINPYPKLFSSAGRILRLWDDLGTAKVFFNLVISFLKIKKETKKKINNSIINFYARYIHITYIIEFVIN